MTVEQIRAGGEYTREVAIEVEQRAEVGNGSGAQRVNVSFSSEAYVLRDLPGVGMCHEVLGHQPHEVDLSRLSAGGPALCDHKADLGSKVGVVESARIVNGRGQAVIRFASTQAGREMAERVVSGEVTHTSVGYKVAEYRLEAGEASDGLPVVRATNWTPFEISFVAIPADPTVGYGRSLKAATGAKSTSKEVKSMNTPEIRGRETGSVAAERHRTAEIMAMGRHFDVPDEDVRDAIERGTSADAFRGIVLDHIGNRPYVPTRAGSTMIGICQALDRPYSLSRAVNSLLTGRWDDAGLEREMNDEIQRTSGRAASGIWIPAAALAGQRDLLTTSTADALVGKTHLDSQFVDALRPQVAVMSLGAKLLPGLVGNVSIPRQTSSASAQWIAEGSAATESTPGFDAISLKPRQLSARVSMSRKQLKQALPGIDSLMESDLRKQIAVALDAAAINGAGGALEPLGVLNTTGIGNADSSAADGGYVTWARACKLISTVEQANAPAGSMGFLANARTKGDMLSTPRFPNGEMPILETGPEGFRLAGYKAAFTSLVPSDLTKGTATDLSALIFGVWSEMIVAQWSGIDLIVDEHSMADTGSVRIVIHAFFDVALRNPESFAAIKDVAPLTA